MADKIFVGSGKIVTTQYGDMTKLSFSEKDINTLKENLINGWVNCVVKKKQTIVEGKPTHYLEVDKWQPANRESNSPKDEPLKVQNQPLSVIEQNPTDDLPF